MEPCGAPVEPLWSPMAGFISSELSPTFVASLLGRPLLWGSLSSFQDHCVLVTHRFPASRLAQLSALTERGLADHPRTSAPTPKAPEHTGPGGRRVGWASVLTEGPVGATSSCSTSFQPFLPILQGGSPHLPVRHFLWGPPV